MVHNHLTKLQQGLIDCLVKNIPWPVVRQTAVEKILTSSCLYIAHVITRIINKAYVKEDERKPVRKPFLLDSEKKLISGITEYIDWNVVSDESIRKTMEHPAYTSLLIADAINKAPVENVIFKVEGSRIIFSGINADTGLTADYFDTFASVVTLLKSTSYPETLLKLSALHWTPKTYTMRFEGYYDIVDEKNKAGIKKVDDASIKLSNKIQNEGIFSISERELKGYVEKVRRAIDPESFFCLS